MAERIEAHCPCCGARYRLRAEAGGRRARCKTCQAVFEVPQTERNLEEDVLRWLADPRGEDEIPVRPRIIRAVAAARDKTSGHESSSSRPSGQAVAGGRSNGSRKAGEQAAAAAPHEG